MVCAEDFVTYFRGLKSYERIWIMCRLQHSCLPFELRFLGTCLEELARKDFYELRQIENEANAEDVYAPEFRNLSDKALEGKMVLYLCLLNARNYACSNLVYKLLSDEEAALARCAEHEEHAEHMLMMYTLALNHPAFSCEQKRNLQRIFHSIQQRFSPHHSNIPHHQYAIRIQDCINQNSPSPNNMFPQPIANHPSHCFPTVPPHYTNELSLQMEQLNSIGGLMRYPFAGGAPLMAPGWSPIVFQGAVPQPPPPSDASIGVPSTSGPTSETSRSTTPEPIRTAPTSPLLRNAVPRTMVNEDDVSRRLSNTDVSDQNQNSNLNDNAQFNSQVTNMEEIKRFVEQAVPTTGLVYTATMATPPAPPFCCHYCIPGEVALLNGERMHSINGYVAAANPISMPAISTPNGPQSDLSAAAAAGLDDQMRSLRLHADQHLRNSSSSNSSITNGSDHSPSETPAPPPVDIQQKPKNKEELKGQADNNWHCTGDSSGGEEKPMERANTLPVRGRVIHGRGRSKSSSSGHSRGRGGSGSGRRESSNEDGMKEMTPIAGSPSSTSDAAARDWNLPTAAAEQKSLPATVNLNNLTYIQPTATLPHHDPFHRTYPSYAAAAAPSPVPATAYHFPPASSDILFPHFPPPFPPLSYHTATTTLPITTCYNCGSDAHDATRCTETTLEEATKQGTYRLDYTPVEGNFAEK